MNPSSTVSRRVFLTMVSQTPAMPAIASFGSEQTPCLTISLTSTLSTAISPGVSLLAMLGGSQRSWPMSLRRCRLAARSGLRGMARRGRTAARGALKGAGWRAARISC
jgi:hypothetical protein